jgi:hypothetical protein
MMRDLLGEIPSSIWIVAGLVVLIGSCYLLERYTGCGRPTYYPGKKAKKKAEKDYPGCSKIKVLSKTKIDYKNDRYRNSIVMLDICGEEARYECWLSPPINSEDVATYHCREDGMWGVKKIIDDLSKKIPVEAMKP